MPSENNLARYVYNLHSNNSLFLEVFWYTLFLYFQLKLEIWTCVNCRKVAGNFQSFLVSI